MTKPPKLNVDLESVLESTYPELASVRERAGDVPAYLVGGAVRDLLLGRGRADLDLVVEGDAAALAALLGADVVAHERFSTAKVTLDGHEIDIATARTETYAQPGALPDVEPATLAADLARRDFTINAMAIPLDGEPRLIDLHGGRDDLAAGLLRVLRPSSFVDDPTRALRAARYAARFDFELEAETAKLLASTDLGRVSGERLQAELLRVAFEAAGIRAFELLGAWGLVELRDGGIELAKCAAKWLESAPWDEIAERHRALLAAALSPPGPEVALAAARPQRPSEAVDLARGRTITELVLARAMGAEWLDSYISDWRAVALEIDGGDLIAAGVPQGPALGHGLEQALRRKLDGEISGREQELAAALEAAEGA
jgi:tRNA nucleotidyltransferase (CCA-adding enzyme)